MAPRVARRLALACLAALARGDHYETLGLKSSCNEVQIKKSYRELAKKWHPDKNRGEARRRTARGEGIGRTCDLDSP